MDLYIHILSPPNGKFESRLRCLNNGDLDRQLSIRIILLVNLISLTNECLGVNTILSIHALRHALLHPQLLNRLPTAPPHSNPLIIRPS